MLRTGFTALHRVVRVSNFLKHGQSNVKSICSAERNVAPAPMNSFRLLSTLSHNFFPNNQALCKSSIVAKLTLPALMQPHIRSLTKFSLKKGKRKSVKAVIKRFKRLHWGGWIRTRCGRHKKMWKKSVALKRRLRQHVFINGQQSMLLDKMVTSFWRRPKYYIDDPYTPYHTRDEFKFTKGKPWR